MVSGEQAPGLVNIQAITGGPRKDAKFALDQARGSRAMLELRGAQVREERRVRGIAKKVTLNEHCDKFSRGIQHFIKFFLGGPTSPQDYPITPTKEELEALYWVDSRSKMILEQLERLRKSLSTRSAAEQDFILTMAEKEIRKKIPLPPFQPAVRKGDLGGGRPISVQTKADVERALAVAGISRFTFQWDVPRDEDSTWNSAVIEVISKKSLEWLGRTMKIGDEESGQVGDIIRRWLKNKSREIQQYQAMSVDEYKKIKSVKSTKTLYQRWRKKVCAQISLLAPKQDTHVVVLRDSDSGTTVSNGRQNFQE